MDKIDDKMAQEMLFHLATELMKSVKGDNLLSLFKSHLQQVASRPMSNLAQMGEMPRAWLVEKLAHEFAVEIANKFPLKLRDAFPAPPRSSTPTPMPTPPPSSMATPVRQGSSTPAPAPPSAATMPPAPGAPGSNRGPR